MYKTALNFNDVNQSKSLSLSVLCLRQLNYDQVGLCTATALCFIGHCVSNDIIVHFVFNSALSKIKDRQL